MPFLTSPEEFLDDETQPAKPSSLKFTVSPDEFLRDSSAPAPAKPASSFSLSPEDFLKSEPLAVPFSRPFQAQEKGAAATGRQVMENPEIGSPPAAPPKRETFLGMPVDRIEQVRQEMEPRPEFMYEGARDVVKGAGKVLTAGPTRTAPANAKQLGEGFGQMLSGGMKVASPLIGMGIVAAPLETIGMLLAGSATAAQVKDTASEMGVPKEWGDFAGDLAAILQGYGMSWASLPKRGGIRGIIESAENADSPAGQAAHDESLIAKLHAMAGQNEQSPAEARIAREILRRKYGIDIPEPGAPATPVAAAPKPGTPETPVAAPLAAEPPPAATPKPTIKTAPAPVTVEAGHTYEVPTGNVEVTGVDRGTVTFNKTLPDGNVLKNNRLPMERFLRMVAPPVPSPAAPPPAAAAPEVPPQAPAPPAGEPVVAPLPGAPVEPPVQGPEPVLPLSSEQSSTTAPILPPEVVKQPAPAAGPLFAAPAEQEPPPLGPPLNFKIGAEVQWNPGMTGIVSNHGKITGKVGNMYQVETPDGAMISVPATVADAWNVRPLEPAAPPTNHADVLALAQKYPINSPATFTNENGETFPVKIVAIEHHGPAGAMIRVRSGKSSGLVSPDSVSVPPSGPAEKQEVPPAEPGKGEIQPKAEAAAPAGKGAQAEVAAPQHEAVANIREWMADPDFQEALADSAGHVIVDPATGEFRLAGEYGKVDKSWQDNTATARIEFKDGKPVGVSSADKNLTPGALRNLKEAIGEAAALRPTVVSEEPIAAPKAAEVESPEDTALLDSYIRQMRDNQIRDAQRSANVQSRTPADVKAEVERWRNDPMTGFRTNAAKTLANIRAKDPGSLDATMGLRNQASLRMFAKVAGIDVPKTEGAITEAIRKWVGPKKYDDWRAAKEKAREEKEQKRQDEIAARERKEALEGEVRVPPDEITTWGKLIDQRVADGWTLQEVKNGNFTKGELTSPDGDRFLTFRKKVYLDYIREKIAERDAIPQAEEKPVATTSVETPATPVETAKPSDNISPESKSPAETKPAPAETPAPKAETQPAAEPEKAAEPAKPETSALAVKRVAETVDMLIEAADRASRSTTSGSVMAEIEAERLGQRIKIAKELAGGEYVKTADKKQLAVLNRTIELAEKVLGGLKTAATAKPAGNPANPKETQPATVTAKPEVKSSDAHREKAAEIWKDLNGNQRTAVLNGWLPDETMRAAHAEGYDHQKLAGALLNLSAESPGKPGRLEPGARVQINRHTGMAGKDEDFGVIDNISTDGKTALVKVDGGREEAIPLKDLSVSSRPAPAPDTVQPVGAGAPAPSEETKQSGVTALVDAVQEILDSGGTLGNVNELTKLAEKHLGSSRTSGNWSPKDMFDAMEAGINKHLIEVGADLMGMPFEDAMKELRDLMGRITSQGVRTEEQVKLQQFSTPPTESFTAARVAGIRPSDVVLEPSAGNGGLAVWPKSIGAEVHVNEISERRQQMLKAAGFNNISAHDGEIINAMLDRGVKPTVVLMNPPFSAGGAKSGPAVNNNQYGFNHVNAALQRLAPGGRLVAILGGGRADDANGGATLLGGPSGKWFTDLARRYNIRANVRVNGKEYQKYGTNFATRIIVIDKTGATPSRVTNAPNWDSVVRGNADTLDEAYNLLKGVADDRPQIAIGSASAAGPGVTQPRIPEGRPGDVTGRSDGGVLPSGGRTPEAGAVGGQPGSGRRPDGSTGARPGRSGEPTGVRQPATQPGAPAEAPAARAPTGGPTNADFQRPVPGADELAASAGMTPQQIIDAAKQALGQKMGKSPAPPPARIQPATPTAAKAPRKKAAAPKPPNGNALSGASDQAMKDLEAWMNGQGGDKPSPLQARAADSPAVNQPVPPQVLINLATIGAEQMLDGATSFPAWSEAMTAKAGPILDFVAQRGNSDPQTVLRQVYQLASEVAKDFGADADPLPPAVDQAEQKDLASQPLALDRDESPRSEHEDSAAYVTYQPTLKGPAHPGDIVETKTMATVPLPEITYRPRLPESVIKDGKLSAVQLEAVAIAGQQNSIILPGGYRASALLGDGTGVGKGRQAAAIMWDNYRQGRKRLVFVTEKWDLMQDIIRDLHGIGANELLRNVDRNKAGQWVTGSQSSVRPFNKWQAGTKVQHDGVLFSTYALIRSENNKGETRASQLEEYLRGNDDGEGAVIIFDESHNLKNAVVGQGGQASQIGVAVKNLLQSIPKLRTTSLSATAATDVMNLGYLDRLGLWGPGTAFPTGFGEFASQIAGGRLAAMEMVARELKAQGKYLSRTLSFKGVTYEEAEHQINPEQADLYRTATKAWRSVVSIAEKSIEQTTNGGSRQKARFLSQFGATQQRFFNLLITALKTPTAVELTQKALAAGKSVVITLVNTNEAAQNREKARASIEGDEDDVPDFDFGPKQLLIDLVRDHYPVQQYADDVDDNGNPIKVPVTRPDPNNPDKMIAVNNPEAEEARDALIAQIDRDLHMPENPLDILINSLGGPAKVAELTGRKERFDSSVGKFVPRGDPTAARKDVNLFEMRAFQEGKKRVSILSTAAGTGISLHAGNDVANQQKRYHITLQVGWSADKAMQMFGRTHRTNQVHPPEYVMLVSDLGGEKRFVSTIARRLGSLGAITKGQKDATSGTDLMDKVNFETEQGRQAAQAFYEALLRNQPVPGAIKMDQGEDGAWTANPEPMTGKEILSDLRMLSGDPPTVPLAQRQNVTKLLNRLLALDPEAQNGTYNYYYDIFQAAVQRAIEQNTLDTGVKTLPGDTFELKEQKPIGKDPSTGAETYYYKVDANVKNKRMSVADLERRMAANASKNPQILRRDTDGKLALAVDANPIVHANGALEEAYYVSTPAKGVPVKTGVNAIRNRVQPVEEWAKKELTEAKRKLQYSDMSWREQRYADAKRLYPTTLKDRIANLELRVQNSFGSSRNELDRSLSLAKSQLAAFNETGDLPADNYERVGMEKARAEEENLKQRVAVAEEAAADPIEWAKREWQEQYDDAPSHTSYTHHLIGGAVMRYWNAVREASQLSNIYTATDTKTGRRVVGVDVPAERIGALLARITGGSSTVNASQLRTDVLRNNLTYQLEGGIQVRRGMIARQPVIQLIPANNEQAQNLKSMGVLYERGVMPMHYVPNNETGPQETRTGNILTRILDQYPVQQDTPPPSGGPGGGHAPLQSRGTPGASYRMAGKSVAGLTVRSQVPNMDSIGASLNDYEVLPGVREVPLSAFEAPNTYYSADDQRRVLVLADQIQASGEINPLIVVVDADGPYVLEGGHRLAALDRLGKDALPAIVVLDTESLTGDSGAIQSRRTETAPARNQSRVEISPTAPGQPPLLQESPAPAGDFPTLKEIKAYWDGAVAQTETIEGQPALWVNGAAMDIILSRMGVTGSGQNSTATMGLALSPGEWLNILDETRVAARHPRPGGFDDALARIGKQIEDVLEVNVPGASRTKPLVVVQAGDSIKREAIPQILNEEIDHAKQMRLPQGVRGLPVEMLDSAPGKKAVAALVRQGYNDPDPRSPFYSQNRAVMAAEVGARLMRGGRYAELGLTPDEAVELATQYIEGLERMHGEKATQIIEDTANAIKENRATFGRGSQDLIGQHEARGGGAPEGRPQGADQLPAEPQPAGPQPVASRANQFLNDETGASRVGEAVKDTLDRFRKTDDEPRRNYSGLGAIKRTLTPGANLAEVEKSGAYPFKLEADVNRARAAAAIAAAKVRETEEKLATRKSPDSRISDELRGQLARRQESLDTVSRELAKLEQALDRRLKSKANPMMERALAAGAWQSIASTMTRSAVNAINRTLDGTEMDWIKMRAALTEDRLHALKQRWSDFSDLFAAADQAQTRDLMEQPDRNGRSFFVGLLGSIEGRKGLDQDLGQTAVALMDSEQWGLLRDLAAQTFSDASERVASILEPEEFNDYVDFLKTDPKGQEAMSIYRDEIEEPLARVHAENEGVFSDTTGPELGAYIPLTPFDPKPPVAGGRRTPLSKPKNQSNYFATGLSDSYSVSMPSFIERISRDVRGNKRASLVQTLRDEGWSYPKPQGWDGQTFIGPDGKTYKGIAQQVSDHRTIVGAGGKITHVPGKEEILPEFLWRGLKPMLQREPPDVNELSRVAHFLNGLALKWTPAELIYHSRGVVGAVNNNTPFLGKSGLDKVLSAPVVRYFYLLPKMILPKSMGGINPESPENLKKLREMAEAGAVPSKMGKVTYDKAFAEMFGVERELSFAPLLYGPGGIDARARILMYDIFKAAYPNGTKTDLYHFVNQIGNYTPEFQGQLEKFAKRSGIGPFATAGMTRNVNGAHAWTGTGPGSWQNRLLQFGLHILGNIAIWAIAYHYVTGKWPTEDKRAKFLQIPVGHGSGKLDKYRYSKYGKLFWGDGPEVGYISMSPLAPIVDRGARLLGFTHAFETHQLGGSQRQVLDAAKTDVLNSLAHPFEGPAFTAATVGLTGVKPYLTRMQERGRPTLGFMPAYPAELKPGFMGGLAPITSRQEPRRHAGLAAERGAQTAAALGALNGFYETLGEGTGFLGNDFGKKGNSLLRLGLDVFPLTTGAVKNATNPYSRAEALRKDRAAAGER